MLLAALAREAGAPAGLTPAGSGGAAFEDGTDPLWRLAHGAELAASERALERDPAQVWVCDAIGACGAELRPLGPTAGYGKPYVRWCGRVPGRNPRHSTRSRKIAQRISTAGL